MNDGTERNHFNFKSIQEEEEEEGKKKKKGKDTKKLEDKLIKEESERDDFEVI
jgi:hypothetical protein